jgi:predicted dehydrogenase
MTVRARCRVSVLGLGAMGLRHARVVASLPDTFELVGAYDVDDSIQSPHTQRLSSEAEAIARADAVIVATPIEAHAGAGLRALAAGRHVLVEKPLCETPERAEELLAACSSGATLFAGHSERFNPVVRALVHLLRDDPAQAIDLRRVGPARSSSHGVLLNVGVHDLDLACYLGGGDMTVRCALGRGGADGEDIAHVLCETAGGTLGHIHVDRTRPTKERMITVVTSRWVYQGDLLAHRLIRAERPDGRFEEIPLVAKEPLVAQALAFGSALRGPPSQELASGADAARAVRLASIAATLCKHAGPVEAEKLSLLMRA